MPIWTEFAEAVKEEDVDIVRMNVGKNDIPSEFIMEYQGNRYPTMYIKVRTR